MISILWHNIIGRLLKPSLPSGIRPPYYSCDIDTNLLRTSGNSAANQRSHIAPGKVRRRSFPKPVFPLKQKRTDPTLQKTAMKIAKPQITRLRNHREVRQGVSTKTTQLQPTFFESVRIRFAPFLTGRLGDSSATSLPRD